MRLFTCLIVVASLALASPISAQEPVANGTVDEGKAARIAYETSGEIYSPFCPGKTLAMCTSSQAADVRREIQDLAYAGMDKDQIKEKIIHEYGEEFRYVEADSFDDAWTFGLIALSLVLAIIAMVMVTRRGGSRGKAASDADAATVVPPAEVEDDDPYLKQVRDQYRS